MDVRILGPLEVVRDGVALDLGARKQRMLLADLALSAPRVVATDRLLEDLWGGEAAGKENALWVYISRLRAILEPSREQGGTATVLVTRDHGYALAVDEDDVDARRFERAAARGAAALREDPAEASRVLTAALAEWRGEVLEEFSYEEFARSEIMRLSERRLTALEDRISADLQLGGAGELVGELEALHTQHPLRERFVGQLMLALYRSGRQADALRAFERFRHRLAEDVGLDPSPELRRLEEQVLLHDERVQPRVSVPGPREDRGAPTNPFKGLRAFDEADAPVFFGRERLVADVLRRIGRGASFVALVGPSGSGKSSIVRAGIVPALRKGGPDGAQRWLVASMVPGAHPFAELEAGLLRSSLDAPDSLDDQLSDPATGILRAALRVLPDEETRLLLVIDQFEELFTLVEADGVRTRFLDGLVHVLDDPHDRVVVAIALRSDFYERPLAHAGIGARLGDAVVNVVPMQPDELETAATEPAARSQLKLEPALLATLVGDVIGEPGALPLFQYALTELVERRRGTTLTLEDYRAIGGVDGALSARAEHLYQELDEEEQQAARQFFLRLVAGGGSDEWSRRRVPASEIAALDADIVAMQQVVERFARHRLLTLDRDRISGGPTVEVAHEALLGEWDRLRQWIDDAREELDHHAALRAAIAEWEGAERDPDYLLTGARLRDHASWADHATMRLTATERAYINRSNAASEVRANAERERVAEEQRLLRAARWRLRALIGLLVLVLGGGAVLLAAVLAPDPPRVALLNVPTEFNPIATQFANGLEQASRDHDIRAEQLVPITDSTAEIQELLASGPDLVVVNSLLASDYGVDLGGLVAEHPDTTFAIVNAGGSELSDPPPNVVTVSFDSAAGSFLAGAAAAAESRTGTVGFVGGTPYIIDDFRLGFEAGARHVDPDVTVLSEYLVQGPPVFAWPGPAQVAAERLYATGADVVFHAAGPAGLGVHRAAQERSARLGVHLWSVGVDADEWAQVDADVRDHVLTSVLKRHDLAVGAAVQAYLDGNLADLALGVDNGGFSLSVSGGHLSPAALDAVDRAEDALARREVRIGPHVAAPATSGTAPDVAWTVRHDGSTCSGDLQAVATADVGSLITIELVNDAPTAVTLDVWHLPSGTTRADVADGASLRSLSLGPLPWSGVTAGAGGRHEVAFEPPVPGVWGVTCHEAADDRGDGVVGLLTAEAVTAPVSATASATFTGQSCTWEGPRTLAVGGLVRVAVRNESDDRMGFGGGMVVPGSQPDDLRSRLFEVITRIRTAPLGLRPQGIDDLILQVDPGESGEALLHVDRPGLWAAACTVQGREVNHPALLVRVES